MQKIEKTEAEIHELETAIQDIEAEFNRPENQTDHEKLGELQKQLDEKEARLEVLLEQWEELLEEDEADE